MPVVQRERTLQLLLAVMALIHNLHPLFLLVAVVVRAEVEAAALLLKMAALGVAVDMGLIQQDLGILHSVVHRKAIAAVQDRLTVVAEVVVGILPQGLPRQQPLEQMVVPEHRIQLQA